MLIAFIVVICLLLVFVATTFFVTYKKYLFDIEDGQLQVKNIGSHLKIYFNEKLVKDVFSPQLLSGESIEIKIKEKDFVVKCKCNSLGNKLKIEILDGEKVIAANGVEIKEKQIKK